MFLCLIQVKNRLYLEILFHLTLCIFRQKPVQQKATPARPPQPLRSASVAVSVSRPGSASARYQSARRPTPHFPPSPASLSSSATSAVDMTPSQSSIERESIAEGGCLFYNFNKMCNLKYRFVSRKDFFNRLLKPQHWKFKPYFSEHFY